jgi:hypothetical protein
MNGLWHGKHRVLRYKPEGTDFVIVNGEHRFNRALYGTHTAFRVEAGDLPEFALYMPGMGGNWRFGLLRGDSSKWLIKAKNIRAVYRPGSLLYDIKDPLLGSGTLHIAVLALDDAEGMIIQVVTEGIDPHVRLFCAFGGATGKKFSRDGDLGADPESSFYGKPEYCVGNRYTIRDNQFQLTYGANKTLEGIFPAGAQLKLADAGSQASPLELSRSTSAAGSPGAASVAAPVAGTIAAPVVTAGLSMGRAGTYYFVVRNPASVTAESGGVSNDPDLAGLFDRAEGARKRLAGRVEVHTPDPFINTLGGALGIAADAIWEAPSYLHGAVAWRMRLPAWRGPYVADPLGWHDRARQHFSSYALSQIVSPEIGPVVADTALHLARQLERVGTFLFSNGYICRNPGGDIRAHHYDMNLVFIDELLDHFFWTGDTAYVRQMWPVLQRHLAWEKRNFDMDGDGLYDAYCCIWASDALEYSGGGVTHSSAYNYKANRVAAELAVLIGEDPAPYRTEADKILRAMNTKLWMPEKGCYAEYIDWGGAGSNGKEEGILHPSAALWTVYHAIDSRVPDPFQSWQSLHYIDTDIPHIPVRAEGLADTHLYTLSTTNWQPYTWSLNNVVMAESLHTALAYWQGGRPEAAWELWKGALVESMYLGASPGNFQQISSYDAMRGELYRDFADPIGMAARSLVEGLFGIQPDALHDTLTIQPGWPSGWEHASLHVPDISIDYTKKFHKDTYTIVPAFGGKMNLQLKVRARAAVVSVTVNGRPASWTNDEAAIGVPCLTIIAAPAASYRIEIVWSAMPLAQPTGLSPTYAEGGMLTLNTRAAKILSVYDPQRVLTGHSFNGNVLRGVVGKSPGNKTLFLQLREGRFNWWYPLELKIISPVKETFTDWTVAKSPGERYDTIGLSPFFNDAVTHIFKNQYLSPRPVSPTLQLPTQGIGNWCYPLITAKIDDAGLRKVAGEKKEIFLPNGVPLATPGAVTPGTMPVAATATTMRGATSAEEGRNIVFTSRWDNYPDSVVIPLSGRAKHAYFLMAGSTNPMQSRITNGVIDIRYKDGTTDELELNNPSTWWPIEQDYYVDGYAFTTGAPRPFRVYLKTGSISNRRGVWTPIKGFTDTGIDGGAATVLDLSLHPGKELDRLVLRTVAREVVIGLMSLTLLRE